MTKHTVKILRRSHLKIFKVCLAILQHAWKGQITLFTSVDLQYVMALENEFISLAVDCFCWYVDYAWLVIK